MISPMSQVIKRPESSPTQSRFVRQYSPSERANALAVYDSIGSLEKASEALGIPMSTLAGWAQNGSLMSEARIQKRADLAVKFENAAHLFLDNAVKKVKKAQFQHLMTGAGIAIDKMQLLRGQPTSITETIESHEVLVILADSLGEAINVTPAPSESSK